MNKTLLGIGVILAGIGLFIGGFFFGQMNSQSAQAGWMMGSSEGLFGPGMMYNGQVGSGMMDTGQNGAGMMGNGMMNGGNNGMMGSMMNGQSGPSMMGGNMMDGQFGSGMMGSFGSSTNVDPLSLEDAETAVTNYLATLDNDNLAIGEIMIFDNHAYAQIIDKTTETGAFEVLIDPATQNVFPEPGPNMMWNTEYGMMSGGMMDGNMMGNFGYAPDAASNFSAEEAIVSAQEYLDAYLPSKTADEKADAFPGYYTIHVLEDGKTIGMLSVNAYSGQVFLHHWHGEFIEMAGEGHE